MKFTRNSQSNRLTVAEACAEIMATVEPENGISYLVRSLRIAGFQKAPYGEKGTYVIPCAGDPYKYMLCVRTKDMHNNDLVTVQFRGGDVIGILPTKEYTQEIVALVKFLHTSAVSSSTSTNFIDLVERSSHSALITRLLKCSNAFSRGTMESALAEYWGYRHTTSATVEPVSTSAPLNLGPVVKAVLRKLPWLRMVPVGSDKKAITLCAKDNTLQLKVLLQSERLSLTKSSEAEYGIVLAGIWLFENYVMNIGKMFSTSASAIEYSVDILSRLYRATKKACQDAKTPVEFKANLRRVIELDFGVKINYPWSQKAIEYFDSEHTGNKTVATVEPLALDADNIRKYFDKSLKLAGLTRVLSRVTSLTSWDTPHLVGSHVPRVSVTLFDMKAYQQPCEVRIYLSVTPVVIRNVKAFSDLQYITSICKRISAEMQRVFKSASSGEDYVRKLDAYFDAHWPSVEFPSVEREVAIEYYDSQHRAHATVEPANAVDSFELVLQNARRLGMTRTGNNNRFITYVYDSNPCAVPGLCLHLTKHHGFGAVFAVFDVSVFDIDDDTSKVPKLLTAMHNAKRILDAGVAQSSDGSKFMDYVIYAMGDMFGADVARRLKMQPQHVFQLYWETFKK